MIQIRALFPVYFDIDKVFIHQCRSSFIFKTFPFHYMAPMAGGIANAYEYGLILVLSFTQSLFAPGIPVYRVMCMLKQVGTGFVDELVSMLMGHLVNIEW